MSNTLKQEKLEHWRIYCLRNWIPTYLDSFHIPVQQWPNMRRATYLHEYNLLHYRRMDMWTHEYDMWNGTRTRPWSILFTVYTVSLCQIRGHMGANNQFYTFSSLSNVFYLQTPRHRDYQSRYWRLPEICPDVASRFHLSAVFSL